MLVELDDNTKTDVDCTCYSDAFVTSIDISNCSLAPERTNPEKIGIVNFWKQNL